MVDVYAPGAEPYCGLVLGNFETEADAQRFFVADPCINKWFRVFEQVRAKPLYTHPCKNWMSEKGDGLKSYRFDILLLPNQDLTKIGWEGGAIAVEIKRSGKKVGPAYSQAWDYVNSCTVDWEIGGVVVVPSYGLVFMGPFDGGPVASLQAQNRFGCAQIKSNGEWEFRSGHTLICRFNFTDFEIGKQDAGKKTGSRG